MQIDIDLLLVITSIADDLSEGIPTSMTLNDHEPPKLSGFTKFFAISG